MVSIQQTCNCGYNRIWNSQNYVENTHIPEGNLRMSSAILLTGSPISKSLRVFNEIGLQAISMSSVIKHQKYIFPAIDSHYNEQNALLLQHIKDEKKSITLSGDGRADSPGHTAKYGIYTLMHTENKKILSGEVVQVFTYNIMITS